MPGGALAVVNFFAQAGAGATAAQVIVEGVTSGAGSVTSVALTVPTRQTVSGSYVSCIGDFQPITDNTQTANEFFAGPSSGSAAAPTFRAIVPADLPVATTGALGVVEPDGTSITISAGVISASGSLSNPMTTAGDIIVGGTAGTPTRLAAGATAGNVLTSNGPGVAPSYQAGGGGGGGALVLLEEHTASGSAALNFTTSISSTYDEYLVEMLRHHSRNQCGHPADAVLAVNGGSTYDASTIYNNGFINNR